MQTNVGHMVGHTERLCRNSGSEPFMNDNSRVRVKVVVPVVPVVPYISL